MMLCPAPVIGEAVLLGVVNTALSTEMGLSTSTSLASTPFAAVMVTNPPAITVAVSSSAVGASFCAPKVISSGASLDDSVPSETVTPIVVLVEIRPSSFSAVAPSAVNVTSPVPALIAK